jgi:replicative DNA helicase
MNMQAQTDFGDAVNLEAEQALLGCLLIDNALLASEVPFLEPEHFGEKLHRETFIAIADLVARGRRADPITLKAYLPDEDVGPDYTVSQYLARLVAEAVPSSFIRDYALAVIDSHAARKAATACQDYAGLFLHRDPSKGITDLVAGLEDELGAVRALAPSIKERESISDVLDSFLRKLGEGRRGEGRSIPLPLPEIADVLQEDGFQAGNLYGLLGSSGEGKTSLMLQILRCAAEAGHPVFLLSYDQSAEQVTRQMISQATGISVSQMTRYNPPSSNTLSVKEMEMIVTETERLRKLPMGVKKLTNQRIGSIVSLARSWVGKVRKSRAPDGSPWGAPLIILDHNRKVTPEDPRAHEGRIAGAVNGAGKAMAEELGAAVLFLNQRNGKGMGRRVPRPIAEDLYGGETAKEDYDAILYIYRPERWRDEQLSIAKDQNEADEVSRRFMLRKSFNDTPRDPENMAEIGTLKVRYGRTGMREFVRFVGTFTKYESERHAQPEMF